MISNDNTPRFFYSDDPRFRDDPAVIQIIAESTTDPVRPPAQPSLLFKTDPMPHYPHNYICVAIRWTKPHHTMYIRKLKLLDPEEGCWVILTKWTAPDDEEARHYTKQLLHMSFPQILPYEPLSESSEST